jgi:hypothetical protein
MLLHTLRLLDKTKRKAPQAVNHNNQEKGAIMVWSTLMVSGKLPNHKKKREEMDTSQRHLLPKKEEK